MKMLDNFLESYYARDSGENSMIRSLPDTRIQLFFGVFRNNFDKLFRLNLLFIFFSAPVYVWTYLCLLELMDPGRTCSFIELIDKYVFYYAPTSLFIGLLRMGTSSILIKIARGQHSYIWHEFWDGIKGNWKQGVLLGICSSFLPLIVTRAVEFYSISGSNTISIYIFPAVICTSFIIWAMVEMLLPSMCVGYRLSFMNQLKNAVILVFATFRTAILIRLLLFSLPLLILVLSLLWPVLFPFLVSAFGIAIFVIYPVFNELIQVSYANYVCEHFLNVNIDGALIDIGMNSQRLAKH